MDSFDRVVRNMMSKFGGTATLVVPSEGTYDPETSEYVTTEVTYEIRVMVFDFTLQSNGTQVAPKTLIEAGDRQVFIQPLNKTDENLTMPTIRPGKDFIEISGVRYNIVTVKEINPSQVDSILLELLVRK